MEGVAPTSACVVKATTLLITLVITWDYRGAKVREATFPL